MFSLCPSHSLFFFLQQAAQVGKIHFVHESLLHLAEIADVPSAFSSQKDLLQLTVSSMRSEGSRRGRPPRKGPASGRTKEGNENKIPQSSDDNNTNSDNQKEIIALFRRIQSSISKGDSASTKKSNSNLSEEKKPSVEPVLEIIQRSRRQVKADTTSNKEGDKVLTRKRGVPKKEQELQADAPVAEFKLTRPLSNFVKRSPIPSSSTPRGKILKSNGEASANIVSTEELKSPRVEKLKLSELKELAKARGIKGYSRLKKSELVELLRS